MTTEESSENRNFSHAWTQADTLNSTYWKKDDSSQCAEPDYGPVGVGRLVRRPNGSWNILFARESGEYFQELIPPTNACFEPAHSSVAFSTAVQLFTFKFLAFQRYPMLIFSPVSETRTSPVLRRWSSASSPNQQPPNRDYLPSGRDDNGGELAGLKLGLPLKVITMLPVWP